MDYGKIVGGAFRLAWQYKSLWILGLFAAGTTAFNIEFPSPIDESYSFDTGNPFAIPPVAIWAYVYFILAMVGLYILLAAICSPALTDAVNRITRGGNYSLGNSFQEGLGFMLRVTAFWIIHLFCYILGFAIIGLPFIVLIVIQPIFIIAAILLGIPIAIFFTAVVESIFSLGERALVLRNMPIADALSEGWTLFRSNFGKCMVLFLINLGLAIGIGMVITVALMIFALPFKAIIPPFEEAWLLNIATGFFLLLPISFVLGGFTGTMFHSLYTLFYFELLDPNCWSLERQTAAPAQ
jgi:hypothetical protein